MDANEIAGSIIGWAVMLGAALWWVRRSKHPSRSIANAFGIFVGVFGGIVLSTLLAVGLLWEVFLPEGTQVPRAIGAVLALAVVIPVWQFATRLIQRPVGQPSRVKGE